MSIELEFADFWAAYPLKRDRLDAQRAYQKARKAGVEHAAIMAGVDAYKRHKPAWQDWKHGATWLNKGGYLDEWTPPHAETPPIDWWEECKAIHNQECGGNKWRHFQRKDMDAIKQAMRK